MNKMTEIWANRLIAGTQFWSKVPKHRQSDIEAELEARIEQGEITEDDVLKIYDDDTGER